MQLLHESEVGNDPSEAILDSSELSPPPPCLHPWDRVRQDGRGCLPHAAVCEGRCSSHKCWCLCRESICWGRVPDEETLWSLI